MTTAITIDTSAIVEILTRGPQAAVARQAMDDAESVFVTSVTRVEAALILMSRFGWSRADFDRGWITLGLVDTVVDGPLTHAAIDAFDRWGKGRAKAGLNFGDCFSYALAATRDVPLLWVGDDFNQTDLQKA